MTPLTHLASKESVLATDGADDASSSLSMAVLSQSTVLNPPCRKSPWKAPTPFVENARFSCDLCPYSTEFEASLRRHLRKHAEMAPELEWAGQSDDAIRSSSMTVLSQGAMSSPPFGAGPWNVDASVPENARYSCDLCPYSTEFEASLKKHVRSHVGISPEGTILGAPISMASEMICEPSNRTSCAPCPSAPDDSGADTSADDAATDVAQKAAPDPASSGSAGWPTTTSHARYGSHTCHLCMYKTPAKGHLIAHFRTHTGEAPYHCATCSRSFSQSSNLRRHEMTHRGERPFHCDTCSRAFTQRGHLIMHARMHRGVPPSTSSTSTLKQ